MISIVVDNRVRLRLDDLSETVVDRLRAAFCYDNPTYRKGTRLTGEPPTIRTWQHDVEGLEISFPRGGMSKVRAVLGAFGIPYSVRDARTWQHPEPGFPDHRWKLRDYQHDLIAAAEKRQNCLLRAPTGAGKTTAGFGLLAKLKRRALVMVWTGNLLDQWRERCESELGITDVGIVRGGETKIRPVTLAMQQTIHERFKSGDFSLGKEFDVLLCDEVQRFAADTLFATVDPFHARYRVGVSAEETRKDEKEFLTYDLFGQVAHAVEEKKLVESGAIVDVEILVVPTDFKAPWYRYRQDWNRLLAQMCADEHRNELALGIARDLAAQHQVIMFTHRVEHARDMDARLVRAGVQSGVMLGGKAEEVVFERTKTGLRDGSHRAGVGTYQAIAQGLDLPSVGHGICVTPIANNRQQFGQVKGRICRASRGKERGQLYYLLDQSIYRNKPIRNFLQWGYRVKVQDRGKWVEGSEYLKG